MYVGCARGLCGLDGVVALVAAGPVLHQGDAGDGRGVHEAEFVVGVWADFGVRTGTRKGGVEEGGKERAVVLSDWKY